MLLLKKKNKWNPLHLYVYPYKMGSRSATVLARALGIPQIRHEHSKFQGRSFKTLINWGASTITRESTKCGKVLNKPSVVAVTGNKLSFFKLIGNKARLVPWTTSRAEAQKWFDDDYEVVIRNNLTSHSGRGIIIASKKDGQKLEDAPLYTRYIPKDSEWRIHIFQGKIIFRQRKIKDPEIKDPETWKVRSHDNGFIFQHNDISIPKDVETQALAAMTASGLDFGGVDVVFNKKQGKAYVLEINSAVGLEGATIEVYANAFRQVAGKGN